MTYSYYPTSNVPLKLWEGKEPFEKQAMEQLHSVARLPFIFKHVAGMPDVHWGLGATIGSVIATKGAIIPAAVGVDVGCVDAETEFLSEEGWVRMDSWSGQRVTQYDIEKDEASFVIPQRYINEPCDEMIHFKTKYGIDMMLTPDHRILSYKSGRDRSYTKWDIQQAGSVRDQHSSRVLGFGNRIRCDFPMSLLSEMALSDGILKMICAVAADAHVVKGRAFFGLKKDRKVNRLFHLLDQTDIWNVTSSYRNEVYRISFPWSLGKHGLENLWGASARQLKIVAKEVLHWDGCIKEKCFYTRRKEEADFVHYAFGATGKRSVMRSDIHKSDGEVDFRVFAHSNVKVGIKANPKSEIKTVIPEDGRKYCFRVPSGFLVLRRGGNIFITGNCGMSALRLGLTANDLPDNLAKLRSDIEQAVPHGRTDNGGKNDRGAWGEVPKSSISRVQALFKPYEKIIEKHPKAKAFNTFRHFGTLGTGNHFIEICLDEEDRVWIMLHSGSRGVGNKIGTYFINRAKEEMAKWHIKSFLPDRNLAYLVENTELFDDYIEAIGWAQEFALQNRREMMETILHVMLEHFSFSVEEAVIDCHHNYLAKEHHFKSNVWITRKGAVRAREKDLAIIPGSMGTGSFIVRGKGNPDSFCSCSHGAGRRMSRRQARKEISLEQHIEAMEGIEGRVDAEVIDESPAAYKDINAVMAAQTDLVEVVHRLRQVVNVKG